MSKALFYMSKALFLDIDIIHKWENRVNNTKLQRTYER